jgi:Na+-transporting NADH:ubiquinone oxidoreductase subunit NqrB
MPVSIPRPQDARDWQIAFLAAFLIFVAATRDFGLPLPAFLVALASGLAVQWALARAFAAADRSLRSALISALSLGLLLRTNELWVAALAAVLAIASKFLLRVRGKHVFNPTNLGILAAVLLTGRAWVSPAQWGSAAFLAFFLAALGLLVTRRCGRLDISLAYLGTHALLNVARVWWLGDRPEVLFHRLASGALIVFAFFMISDPRSTPDSRGGRILFAALVATVAYYIQFRLFVPSAPLWALLVVSPLTPLIDLALGGRRFEWASKGVSDAPPSPLPARA